MESSFICARLIYAKSYCQDHRYLKGYFVVVVVVVVVVWWWLLPVIRNISNSSIR